MGCSVPFKNSDMNTSFFVFRPVMYDDFIHPLKEFSISTQALGCTQSAIFRSIHGNLIVWYGAWKKSENNKRLSATLLSMVSNLSSMAVLLEHGVFEAYAGESKDGSQISRFYTGDTISMKSVNLTNEDTSDLSYACLAIFKSRFSKLEGAVSGVCFKCQSEPRILNLIVWKSLQSCYSWLLTADYRKTIMPYLDEFSTDVKYDLFKVVYVSGDYVPNFGSNVSQNVFEFGPDGE